MRAPPDRGWASFAVIGLMALPGQTVRLQPPQALDARPLEEAVVNVQRLDRSAGESTFRSEVIPKRFTFKNQWLDFWRAEQSSVRTFGHLSSQLQGAGALPIRMVLGVFSRAGSEDHDYRQMIRNTWFRQSEVCLLNSAVPAANCSVYVTFVVGNDTVTDTGEKDLTVLPIRENMNMGKTHAWFYNASRTYTWATHIAKMDMDAFPHLAYVLYWMRRARLASGCGNVFGGRPWTCTDEKFCPPADCGLPGDNFLQYNTSDDSRCFSYMQGGFYFISRELARQTSKLGEFWDAQSQECYPEDAVTGRAITRYANRHKLCVSTVRFYKMDAYWHKETARPWCGCNETCHGRAR